MSDQSVIFYQKLQARLARLFVSRGQQAILRQNGGTDRSCVVIPASAKSVDRLGNMVVGEETNVFFSPTLDSKPDPTKEQLVLLDPITKEETATYRLTGKAVKHAPGGVLLAWQCRAREL